MNIFLLRPCDCNSMFFLASTVITMILTVVFLWSRYNERSLLGRLSTFIVNKLVSAKLPLSVALLMFISYKLPGEFMLGKLGLLKLRFLLCGLLALICHLLVRGAREQNISYVKSFIIFVLGVSVPWLTFHVLGNMESIITLLNFTYASSRMCEGLTLHSGIMGIDITKLGSNNVATTDRASFNPPLAPEPARTPGYGPTSAPNPGPYTGSGSGSGSGWGSGPRSGYVFESNTLSRPSPSQGESVDAMGARCKDLIDKVKNESASAVIKLQEELKAIRPELARAKNRISYLESTASALEKHIRELSDQNDWLNVTNKELTQSLTQLSEDQIAKDLAIIELQKRIEEAWHPKPNTKRFANHRDLRMSYDAGFARDRGRLSQQELDQKFHDPK